MANMMSTPQTSAPTLASVTSAPPFPKPPAYVATKAVDDAGRPVTVYASPNPSDPIGSPTGTTWRQKANAAGVDKYVRNMQGTSGRGDTRTQGATYLVNGVNGVGSDNGGSTPVAPTATSEVLMNVGGGRSVWPGEDSAHGSTAMRANKFAEPAKVGVRKRDALAGLIERESSDYIKQRTRQ